MAARRKASAHWHCDGPHSNGHDEETRKKGCGDEEDSKLGRKVRRVEQSWASLQTRTIAAVEMPDVPIDLETVVAGEGKHSRWAHARAHRGQQHVGRGNASGCRDALSRAHWFVIGCQRCGGLVDEQSARRAAKLHTRGLYSAGGGCSSRRCSRYHRPAKYVHRQHAMARAAARMGGRHVRRTAAEEYSFSSPRMHRRQRSSMFPTWRWAVDLT